MYYLTIVTDLNTITSVFLVCEVKQVLLNHSIYNYTKARHIYEYFHNIYYNEQK